jgi:RimJ/RimL family protein N-acetyltransferase
VTVLSVPTVRPIIHDDIELLIAWRADRRVNEWYGGFEQATPEAIQADWDDEAWCERGIIEVDGRPVGFVQWYEADADAIVPTVYRLAQPTGVSTFSSVNRRCSGKASAHR